MVLFFCLTTLQNWQNCPAALTNHSGFLSIQLGFFRTSRGGANSKSIVHTVEIFALQLHKTGMQAKQGRQIVERHSGEDILHNEWTLFRMEVR